jgi:hypothetical protein
LFLNNEGVEFMKCGGNCNRAFSVFSRGLKMAKQVLILLSPEVISHKDASSDITSSTPIGSSMYPSRQQFFKRDDNMESQPLVCNCPLSIPASRVFPTWNDDALPNILKLAFIQLFNLALSVHLSALEQQDRKPTTDGGSMNEKLVNKKKYQKALRLYESEWKWVAPFSCPCLNGWL